MIYPANLHYLDLENNKIQNVGRAVIYQYKSSHALEHAFTSPSSNKLHSLTHCQKCNKPFMEPITLTCGFTLCRQCLPSTSSQCLSFSCLRIHTNEIYRPTTLLENILAQSKSSQNYADLFDCSICLSTLIEPITTQCGHTFCKECLIRTMIDMPTRSCPYCRTELSRIGKVNQLVSDWMDFLNNCLYEEQQQHIPIIQVTSAVAFPTQHCLIHITQDRLSLLKRMTTNSRQKHYAICMFSSSSHDFYEHGMMLQIDGVEHVEDLRHSVVQASGLFRLRVNHLRLDEDGCYTGEVTRLDDLVHDRSISNLHHKTANVITTQSTPTRKIARPRPCSMRLSSSAPSHQPTVAASCPGSVYRKTWAMDFKKSLSPPPTPTFKKQQAKLPIRHDTGSLDELYHAQFCPVISRYVLDTRNTAWMMQYEWYLQQTDRTAIVWWAANILPLTFEEKMAVLRTDSLRERMAVVISLVNN